MSRVILITRGILRQEMSRPRVIMGYLLGLTLLAMGLRDFLGYAMEIKEPVNLLEAFIVTENQSTAGIFWLTGYLLILADAPFVQGNTCMILYRSGRRIWSMGMLLYVLIQAFLYTACFAALSVAASIPRGFHGRIWSSPVYLLATNTSTAIAEKYHLSFEGVAMMKHMTVLQAFGITFLYMFCYLAVIGVLLYVCSLVMGGFWGLAVAATAHLGGRFLSWIPAGNALSIMLAQVSGECRVGQYMAACSAVLTHGLPWSPVPYIDGGGGHWRYPCVSLIFLLIMTIVLLAAVNKVDIPARMEGGA